MLQNRAHHAETRAQGANVLLSSLKAHRLPHVWRILSSSEALLGSKARETLAGT